MNRITVLIPVLGNQGGLDRSLESLRRSDGGFDVIIVDDGSSEPIRADEKLREDVRVWLLRLPANRGIAGALNAGLALAMDRGYEYIARLDAGDVVLAHRFRRQAGFLDARPSCAVVASSVDFVDAGESVLFRYRAPCDHSEIVRRLHVDNCMMHPASMIRASALRDVGFYREDVPGAEDYELFLRIARRYELAAVPEALTRLEYDPAGISVAGRRRQRLTRLRLQLAYFDPWAPQSFVGVGRTLLAMAVPSGAVFQLKRRFMS